ncbi:hypothetical protein KA183_03170 [bacterium]|nr:hypothetical protein [bacterium]
MPDQELNLNEVCIASPCPVKWDQMQGDEQTRFCDLCNLNVYNISKMTRAEATELLKSKGDVCLRLYRRKDGTVMTKDCPVGVNAAQQFKRRVIGFAAAAFAIIGGAGLVIAQKIYSEHVNSSELELAGRPYHPGLESISKKIGLNDIIEGSAMEADSSASDKYKEGLRREEEGKTEEALCLYKQATDEIRESNFKYDSLFRKMLANKYSNLLRARGEEEKAIQIEKEFLVNENK